MLDNLKVALKLLHFYLKMNLLNYVIVLPSKVTENYGTLYDQQ